MRCISKWIWELDVELYPFPPINYRNEHGKQSVSSSAIEGRFNAMQTLRLSES